MQGEAIPSATEKGGYSFPNGRYVYSLEHLDENMRIDRVYDMQRTWREVAKNAHAIKMKLFPDCEKQCPNAKP